MFDIGLLVHLAAVAAVIGVVVAVTVAVRRRDRDRFAASVHRLALHRVDDPTTAPVWEYVEHAFDRSGTTDLAATVGLGNALTRRRFAEVVTPTAVHVNDAVVAGRRAGVAAVISARVNTKVSGAMTYRKTTSSRDIVVARLSRSIEGSIRGSVHAPVGFDVGRLRGLADRLDVAGLRTALLSDPDIGRAFVPERPADVLVDNDEWLRALLWAIRPAAGAAASTPATERYESMIPARHVLNLDGVAIVDDVIVLTMPATPWKAGVNQELIELAEHLVTRFR